MTTFDKVFAIVVGEEGGFDNKRSDRGNWTSGFVGKGTLNGTKYGISAASYPTVDIVNVTLAQAKAIYQRDYWDKIDGDLLPPALALMVFDYAVNSGVTRSVETLQAIIGATVDGEFGPLTLHAVDLYDDAQGLNALCAEFNSRRMVFMASTQEWPDNDLGWSRRVMALPYHAASMETSQ